MKQKIKQSIKEIINSTDKNYLVSKATVLLSEGNQDEAITLMKDLSEKYLNDRKIQRIQKSWEI